MQDKVYLLTGATAGIGLVTARKLAQQGVTLVMVGRNAEKTAALTAEIKQQSGNPRVSYLLADLSLQRDVRALAENFLRQYPRLDVLINNAGAIFMSREESAEGIEMTLATNHLNYFLLTHLLLDRLKASVPARIVNVASNAHEGARLNFDDLQNRRGYSGQVVYGQSKLMNILFTEELARRLAGTQVTVNCLHPGLVATNFLTNNRGILFKIARRVLNLVALTPEQGAHTMYYLATAPEVAGVTGKYFDPQGREARPTAPSHTEADAKKLWALSEQLTGIAKSN